MPVFRPAAIAAAALLATAAAARAAPFSGSYENVNPVASPVGRCAPAARTVVFGPADKSAEGVSNFGAFAPSGSHCITPPPAPYFDGVFTFDFGGGDALSGVYSGALTLSGTPGLFDNVQNFVATGGTGEFAGATGSFTGIGTVQFLGMTGFADGRERFSGELALMPEPGGARLLLAELAILGVFIGGSRACSRSWLPLARVGPEGASAVERAGSRTA